MSIPIVIFHIGDQEYFKKCVRLNSIKNDIILVGDNTNNYLFRDNKKVKHYHTDNLTNNNIKEFTNSFVNYSTNNSRYELKCFLRIFYIKELLLQTNIPKIFHIDSDCIILEDISKINFPKNICYSLQENCQNNNPFNMVGSIHNALLDLNFCNKFIDLCFDIYKHKTKFNLIKDKILWHRNNKIAGGICDMTLYYLLHSEKILDVHDLNMPLLIDGEECVFDHQLSRSYGYLGEQTYKLKNRIKNLNKVYNKYYIEDINNKQIRLLSIHYQGNSKKLLTQLGETI